MSDGKIREPAEELTDGQKTRPDPAAAKDATRCRKVEDALFRRACGYKVRLKKSYKVKTVEYDRDTGKKLEEREDLRDGFEEVHIPSTGGSIRGRRGTRRGTVRWSTPPWRNWSRPKAGKESPHERGTGKAPSRGLAASAQAGSVHGAPRG